MALSVLGLTVLRENPCGMCGAVGNSPGQSHCSLFSSPAASFSALLSQIAPRDLAQQQQEDSELFVPSVLAGRCKASTLTGTSSIHQEKPAEHFVMYKETLVQPFS